MQMPICPGVGDGRSDPKRPAIIKEAIKNLKGWDTPDSAFGGGVRILMAQLNIAKGEAKSLADARRS